MGVWDIRRGKGIKKQIVHNGEVNCLCFSPYNDMLVSLGLSNGSLLLLDLRRLSSPLSSLKGHKKPVRNVSFSPHDYAMLASGAEDGMVCIWDLSRSQENRERIKRKTKVTDPPELIFLHRGCTSSINDLAWNPESAGVIANVGCDRNFIWKPQLENFCTRNVI